jgi:hypothetical protein
VPAPQVPKKGSRLSLRKKSASAPAQAATPSPSGGATPTTSEACGKAASSVSGTPSTLVFDQASHCSRAGACQNPSLSEPGPADSTSSDQPTRKKPQTVVHQVNTALVHSLPTYPLNAPKPPPLHLTPPATLTADAPTRSECKCSWHHRYPQAARARSPTRRPSIFT